MQSLILARREAAYVSKVSRLCCTEIGSRGWNSNVRYMILLGLQPSLVSFGSAGVTSFRGEKEEHRTFCPGTSTFVLCSSFWSYLPSPSRRVCHQQRSKVETGLERLAHNFIPTHIPFPRNPMPNILASLSCLPHLVSIYWMNTTQPV